MGVPAQNMESDAGYRVMQATDSIGSAWRCFSTDRAGDGCHKVAREVLGLGGKSEQSE